MGENKLQVIDEYRDLEPQDVQRQLQAIRAFQAIVKKEMIEKHDYGTIPGTSKPTLLKPGAEKMVKLMKLADTYETDEAEEDWDKPFFHYRIKCKLVSMSTGEVISEGVGSANSFEAKWRYRWMFPNEIPDHIDKESLRKRTGKSKKNGKAYTQYRVENEDIYDQVNTILKMAKKPSDFRPWKRC